MVVERRAKLVADVGNEPLLRIERLFQPAQHVVDRCSEPAQLVVRHADRDALAEILRAGDLLGGFRDGFDRTQRSAGQDAAADGSNSSASRLPSSSARRTTPSASSTLARLLATSTMPMARSASGIGQ